MCETGSTHSRTRLLLHSAGPGRRRSSRATAKACALLILAGAASRSVDAQETVVHTPTASPAAMRPDDPMDVVVRASLSGPLTPPQELVLFRDDGTEITRLLDDGEPPDAEAGDYSYAGIVRSDQFTVDVEGCDFFFAATEEPEGGSASDPVRICFIEEDIPIGIPPLEPPESLEGIVVEDESTRERFRSDEVLLKFDPGVSFDAIIDIVGQVDGNIKGFLPLTGVFQVEVPTDGTVEGLRSVLEFFQSEDFEETIIYATPNHQLYHDQTRPRPSGAALSPEDGLLAAAAFVPNDRNYPRQEHYLDRIRAEQAWGRLLEAPVRLQAADMAVLDTGFANSLRRDFVDNLRHQRDCIDQDDLADDVSTDAHGSQVASVAAAGWNNGHKIAGLAMNRQFVPVRIKRGSPGPAPARPDGFVINVICGFEYAMSLAAPGAAPPAPRPPIKVINASFGTFDDSVNARVGQTVVTSLEDVVRLAIQADIVVVASTTNVAFPDEPRNYLPSPASHNLQVGDGLIVVGGSTSRDRLLIRPVESRRGAGVDLAAPGRRIQVIDALYRDARNDGTSFSTALVTAAVSLLRSRVPRLAAPAVERVIKAAADSRSAVPGGRRLNVDRALRQGTRP